MKLFRDINWRRFDAVILIISMILLGVGLYCIWQVDVFSSSDPLFNRQLLGVILGMIVMVIAMVVDYRIICQYSIFLYIGICLLLVYTLFFGVNINNVTRWVNIFGIQLQPSELAKTVLIIFLAFCCNALRDQMDKFYTLLILGAATLLPMVIILMQPHLSSTMVLLFICIVIGYSSGLSYRIIGIAAAIAGVFLVTIFIVVGVFKYDKLPLIKPYMIERILDFSTTDDSEDLGGKFQQNQSIAAIATGGQNGKLLEGDSATRSYSRIYSKESDFVFAVVGEEFGFLGCTVIIVLYFILVVRCLIIGAHAPDYMGKLICSGVAGMLMFQAFANIGVATSILPNTGLPLPFISYGLTSLVNSMAAVGVVLNVGLRRNGRGY